MSKPYSSRKLTGMRENVLKNRSTDFCTRYCSYRSCLFFYSVLPDFPAESSCTPCLFLHRPLQLFTNYSLIERNMSCTVERVVERTKQVAVTHFCHYSFCFFLYLLTRV